MLPIIVVFVILIFAGISALLSKILFKFAIVKSAYEKIKKKIFWNSFLRSSLEGYLEIVIAIILRVTTYSFKSFTESASSVAGFTLLFLAVAYPVYVWVLLFRNFDEKVKPKNEGMALQVQIPIVRTQEFKQKYGSLTEDLNLRSKLALIYQVIFMFRRLGLALIIFSPALFHMSGLTFQLLVVGESLQLFYIGAVMPFTLKHRNTIELINQSVILLNAYYMYVYCDFVLDVETRYATGWSNLILLLVFILGSALGILSG